MDVGLCLKIQLVVLVHHQSTLCIVDSCNARIQHLYKQYINVCTHESTHTNTGIHIQSFIVHCATVDCPFHSDRLVAYNPSIHWHKVGWEKSPSLNITFIYQQVHNQLRNWVTLSVRFALVGIIPSPTWGGNEHYAGNIEDYSIWGQWQALRFHRQQQLCQLSIM